jgi:hypothetical protein
LRQSGEGGIRKPEGGENLKPEGGGEDGELMVDWRFRGLEVHGSRFRGRDERRGVFPQISADGRRGEERFRGSGFKG